MRLRSHLLVGLTIDGEVSTSNADCEVGIDGEGVSILVTMLSDIFLCVLLTNLFT